MSEMAKRFTNVFTRFIARHSRDELIRAHKLYKCLKCQKFSQLNRVEVDYFIKDRIGRAITEDAAINLNLNMIKCEKCAHEFCNKCEATPYHIGYTCDAYTEYRSKNKCRVCLNTFKNTQTKSTN